jgi:hypothetical protein
MANDDNIPHDDDDGQGGGDIGPATWIILGTILGLWAVTTVVAWIADATASKSSEPEKECSTSCALFLRWECPGNRYMGGCFGASVCAEPRHPCGTNPP